MRPIAEGVYQFPFMGGFVNVFAVVAADGWLVIDAGMNASMTQKVADTLARHSDQPIAHVFITHAHYDHVGGLAHLQTLTNATTYAHQRETAIIRREKPPVFVARPDKPGIRRLLYPLLTANMRQTAERVPPARVDVEVKDGTPIAGQFTVIELPGHAYGHVGLWWAERRLLFGGDVMIHMPLVGLRLPLSVATPDMPEAKRSIGKIAQMQIDTLCLCHGAPIVGRAHERISAFAAKIGADG